MHTKQQIRKEMLAKRKALPADMKEQYSHEIVQHFLGSKEFQEAETILCYVSMKDEVSTVELMETAWKFEKRIGVPKVLGSHEMEFFEISNFKELHIGYKGILEPEMKKKLEPDSALVIVPGTVFDYSGRRIGYGGGFYDTYLQKHPMYQKAAFAFSMQIIDEIPVEPHDISMDLIYTEKGKI